jgi:glycosyltransferase involved in cell wall biosynthesis
MPEVANGSSVLVDPTNIEEINEALKKMLQTDKGSNPLVASGFTHAKSLSWEATAKKTIALYKKLT